GEGGSVGELPDGPGQGTRRGVQTTQGLPDESPAVGRPGDGDAVSLGEVVDDRSERPGVRSSDESDEGGLWSEAGRDRLRRVDRFRWPARGAVRRGARAAHGD